MSNLKPAPFFLNERTAGAIVADRPGPAVVYLPFLGVLVDYPHEPDADPLIEPAPERFPSPDCPDGPLPHAPEEELS